MIHAIELRHDVCLVLLAPNPEDQRTEAGLIVAHAITPTTCYGRVLRVGPEAVDVKRGDLVAFPPSAGEPYPYKDFDLLFVHEREIAFVLDPKGES